MDVAAFVFGVLPAALYALDNYQRLLKPAKNYMEYSIVLQQMQSHIYLQQEQLNATMATLGLDNPTAAQLRDHLRAVYTEDKCERFMTILERMKDLLERMMEKLDVDVHGKPRWSDDPPERVDWEWRKVKRSFGDKKRKELIDELQYWNSGLKAIVEKPEIPFPDEDANSPVKRIQARRSVQECDKIREGLGLVHQAFQKTRWRCHCTEHRAVIRLSWHAENEKTAAGGDFGFSFAGRHPSPSWQLISVDVMETEKARLVPPTPSRSPSPSQPETKNWRQKLSIGRRRKHQKLAEDVQASDPAVQLPPSAPPSPQQISCMCEFINGSLDSNAGVIKVGGDDSTDKLVAVKFVKGVGTVANPEVRLLGSLLSNSWQLQRQPGIFLLSRKQRLEIAAAVSWAALYLCGTPWLGPDWNGKDDVQVFLQTQGQQHHRIAALVAHSGISYVFKPEPPQATAATPASDASGFPTRQIRNRALFTLGILLLELCLGKTFEQIHQDMQTANLRSLPEGGDGISSSTSPAPTEYDMAIELIDEIHIREGEQYGNAVQRCLRCEFPGRDVTKDFTFQSFRKHFLDGVVAPVQATFESCI